MMELKNIENIRQIQITIDNSNIEYLNKKEEYHIRSITGLFKDYNSIKFRYKDRNRNFTRYILMRIELELKIFKNFGNLLIKKVMLITLYILSIFMLGLLYLKIMQMNLIMKETN